MKSFPGQIVSPLDWSRAFKAVGTPVETMVAPGEGHGSYKPQNRAALYRRMEAFLSEHIGPGAS